MLDPRRCWLIRWFPIYQFESAKFEDQSFDDAELVKDQFDDSRFEENSCIRSRMVRHSYSWWRTLYSYDFLELKIITFRSYLSPYLIPTVGFQSNLSFSPGNVLTVPKIQMLQNYHSGGLTRTIPDHFKVVTRLFNCLN